MNQPEELRFRGLGVSEGIVVGQVLRMHHQNDPIYHRRLQPNDVDAEIKRFHTAVALATQQLTSTKQQAEKRFGKDHAYIFDAHLLMLEDEKLLHDIESYIASQLVNAEWAVKVVGDRILQLYSQIEDEYLRERGSDVEDVMQRMLATLAGSQPEPGTMSENAVIVARDLLPSAVADLDFEHARALATDSGGWTSHTAILARGVGIPAVVGLRDLYRRTKTGDRIIVDSSRNEVILHPSTVTLEKYKKQLQPAIKHKVSTDKSLGPAKTLDGVAVTLRANVEVPSEFEDVEAYGAAGIGLYRSEYLLSRRGTAATEEEQFAAYKSVARVAGDQGAVIRLFDLGGDTIRDYQESEKNPALGLRAIRFSLSHEDLMRIQVRAIMRAALSGRLRIVLPMVADSSDVARARQIFAEEAERLRASGDQFSEVELGAMIELPSAVLMADSIATAVDFFELGTNDLVQYTLAVDRGNDEVAQWFRTLHPAVLRSIDQTLRSAERRGIPAIVCGEMASTPAYAVLLIGLGATDLSMTPSSIPRVRRALAGIEAAAAKVIVEECLKCDTAEEVEELVRDELRRRWPNLFDATNLPQPRDRD